MIYGLFDHLGDLVIVIWPMGYLAVWLYWPMDYLVIWLHCYMAYGYLVIVIFHRLFDFSNMAYGLLQILKFEVFRL